MSAPSLFQGVRTGSSGPGRGTEPPQVFLFLTAAHGRAQVLLFTFVCENVSRKKQKVLVVARPCSGPGFEPPQYPASSLLWLQAPLSSSWEKAVGKYPGFSQGLLLSSLSLWESRRSQ